MAFKNKLYVGIAYDIYNYTVIWGALVDSEACDQAVMQYDTCENIVACM